MIRNILICVLLFAAVPAEARFGEKPDAWLQQMEHALAHVNYRGTFVYIHGEQAETMLVYHQVDENGTRERLVSLNGSAREVLRNDDEVKCILPDDRTVYVEKRPDEEGSTLTQGIPLNAVRAGDHYEFQLLGTGRIAGRSSRLVAIKPRDEYRYGYRLWLDEETALPLRSELVNNEDRPIEKMMFTEIEIGADIDESMLEPSVSGEDYKWHVRDGGKETVVENAPPVEFGELPPGYSIVRTEVRSESAEPSYHFVVSDGLASVSVFVEPRSEEKPALKGLSQIGAVNAYGVVAPEHHVTVVGEVPDATVEAIGEAVRFVRQ